MVNTTAKELSLISNSSTEQNELLHYYYQPLQTGELAPSFSINTQQGLINSATPYGVGKGTFISLHDFLDYGQPLVILFLGAASRTALQAKKLELLQANVQQQGGKLLVLTTVETKYIKRQLKDGNVLSVFHDKDNEVAEAFGLFNEQNPLWQWVSGIEEEEEALSALYVIAPDRTVAYRYVDFNFILHREGSYSSLQFFNEMLTEVHKVSQQYRSQETYRLVS